MAILPATDKHLILDFDGVITRLIIDWSSLKKELNQTLRLPPDTDQHTSYLYAKAFGQFPLYQEIVSRYEMAHLNEARLSPLISEIIASKTPFSLVSNNCRRTLNTFISQTKLDSLCLKLIACDDVAFLKPHPEGILSLIADTPDNYVYIGDQLHDQLAAKLAGVEFIRYSFI